jgi:hypothetical protein
MDLEWILLTYAPLATETEKIHCIFFIYIIYLCYGVGAAQEVLWLPTTG